MSWTYATRPSAILAEHPSLVDNQVLLQQWPAFRDAAEELKNAAPPEPGPEPPKE